MRPSALVKISGDLLASNAMLARLKELSEQYFTVVCVGGGTQINAAFRQKGYPIDFGPRGRITRSYEERALAREVLEQNQADFQDLLADSCIQATVVIPVLEIGSVLNHINGDDFAILATGFDQVFVFTMRERVVAKSEQLSRYGWIAVEGF